MTFKTFLISLGSTLAAAAIALACDSPAKTDSTESAAKPVSTSASTFAGDAQEAQLRLRAIGDAAQAAFTPANGGLTPGPASYPETVELPTTSKCYDYSFKTSDDGQRFDAEAVPKPSCEGAPRFKLDGSVQDGTPKVSEVSKS